MPEEGYKSITVTEKLYKELQQFAEKTCRSIPQAIEYLMKTNNNSGKREA